MNAIAAAITAIVSIGIVFADTIYNIILDLITAHAQNITTTPPTNCTTTTPTKTGLNAITILNAVNSHMKTHNATATEKRQPGLTNVSN
jgi:hypothetical protein